MLKKVKHKHRPRKGADRKAPHRKDHWNALRKVLSEEFREPGCGSSLPCKYAVLVEEVGTDGSTYVLCACRDGWDATGTWWEGRSGGLTKLCGLPTMTGQCDCRKTEKKEMGEHARRLTELIRAFYWGATDVAVRSLTRRPTGSRGGSPRQSPQADVPAGSLRYTGPVPVEPEREDGWNVMRKPLSGELGCGGVEMPCEHAALVGRRDAGGSEWVVVACTDAGRATYTWWEEPGSGALMRLCRPEACGSGRMAPAHGRRMKEHADGVERRACEFCQAAADAAVRAVGRLQETDRARRAVETVQKARGVARPGTRPAGVGKTARKTRKVGYGDYVVP